LALDVSGHEYPDHEPWVLADRPPDRPPRADGSQRDSRRRQLPRTRPHLHGKHDGQRRLPRVCHRWNARISVGRSITSLAAFLSGAIVGGYFYRGNAGPIRCHWLRGSATCEAALLFAAAIAVIALDGDSTALQDRQYAVIVLLAVAMGLRTATVRQLAVPDLTTTTMVTITLTALVADLALAGSSNSHTSRRVEAPARY